MANTTPEGRQVRTVEGARFFGLPVGATIQNRSTSKEAVTKRATSLTRLMSLKNMFDAAKRVGNIAQMRNVQEDFTTAVRSYAATNGQLTEVLDTLVATRGRADKALGKKKNQKD